MAELTSAQQKRFEQIRNTYLLQWYTETQSSDTQIRLTAQARLQLLRTLRKQRAAIKRLKLQLSFSEASQDMAAARAVRRSQRAIKAGRKSNAQIFRGQQAVTDPYVERMARKWRKKTCTLENVLEDVELDTWADFWCVAELDAMEDDFGNESSKSVQRDSGAPLEVWVRGRCSGPAHLANRLFNDDILLLPD